LRSDSQSGGRVFLICLSVLNASVARCGPVTSDTNVTLGAVAKIQFRFLTFDSVFSLLARSLLFAFYIFLLFSYQLAPVHVILNFVASLPLTTFVC
jgi:hypothetical protein